MDFQCKIQWLQSLYSLQWQIDELGIVKNNLLNKLVLSVGMTKVIVEVSN